MTVEFDKFIEGAQCVWVSPLPTAAAVANLGHAATTMAASEQKACYGSNKRGELY